MAGITLIAGIANLGGAAKFFTRNSKTKIGEIFIDASLSEIIEYSSEITEHPIESGGNIADHVYTNPISIKINGFITDTVVDVISTVQSATQLFSGNITNNFKQKLFGDGIKQITAYQALRDMHTQKALIDIVCKLDTFDNMVIQKLTFPKDEQTGDRLIFEATLQQLKFANVRTTSVFSSRRSITDAYSSKTNLGSQQTREPSDTEAAKARSIAKPLVEGVINLFR